MDANTAILVGVIGAIFAGVVMILKVMMPFMRRNGKLSPASATPPAKVQVRTQASQPALAHTLEADGSGRYDAQATPPPPWQAFTDTLHGVDSKVAALESKFDSKFDGMREEFKELKAEVAAESRSTRSDVTEIHRALGRLEGKTEND